jgi:hypothetical protein|tara:strand:+ start:104 stop:352 length:249 start_codon:yes stop_codon:yes gene_type:complete
MEYVDIREDTKVTPGEYLYYKPSDDIVVCGSYDQKTGILKALFKGKLIKDNVGNFQKIKLSREEQKSRRAERKRCGSCRRKL